MSAAPADRLFVALDMPDVAAARILVAQLSEAVTGYKVGLELLFGGGLGFAAELKSLGKTVFLDMKLLDIPHTVEKAVANVARYGVDWLTVHGTDRKTLEAAVRGRGDSALKVLAVTVLTSLDETDLVEQGITTLSPQRLVLHRAGLARAAGIDGVVASGQEAAAVRALAPEPFAIVTPGIRLSDGPDGDQARVMTPRAALAAGATHLVVGRPITAAADPVAAAHRVLAAMA
jgi:orotidine-5'-phosphate decarboxylase